MTDTPYTILHPLTDEVVQDILDANPGLLRDHKTINSGTPQQYTIFTFDHTADQSFRFKKFLTNKLGLYNDALAKYTNKNTGTVAYMVYSKVTFTNVGSTYRNVFADSDGMSFPLETDIYDQIFLCCHWTKIGTGTQSLQVVDVNTPANVIATLSNLVSNRNNSGWVDIPDTLKNTTNFYVIQAKSTVAADDPVFIGLWIYMK